MVEERSAQPVELVDDTSVLVVDAVDLGRELRAGFVRRREPRLGCALLLGRAQALELASQRGRGAFGVGASRRLFLEQLSFFLHEAARLFGGPQVAAREGFHFGQSFTCPAPTGDRRGVDGDRVDAEHRCGRQGRPGPLGEHLVEEHAGASRRPRRKRGRQSRADQREERPSSVFFGSRTHHT